MPEKTYRVERGMTNGAVHFARGDKRELSEGDAATLVALGALTEVEDTKPPKPAPKAKAAK